VEPRGLLVVDWRLGLLAPEFSFEARPPVFGLRARLTRAQFDGAQRCAVILDVVFVELRQLEAHSRIVYVASEFFELQAETCMAEVPAPRVSASSATSSAWLVSPARASV